MSDIEVTDPIGVWELTINTGPAGPSTLTIGGTDLANFLAALSAGAGVYFVPMKGQWNANGIETLSLLAEFTDIYPDFGAPDTLVSFAEGVTIVGDVTLADVPDTWVDLPPAPEPESYVGLNLSPDAVEGVAGLETPFWIKLTYTLANNWVAVIYVFYRDGFPADSTTSVDVVIVSNGIIYSATVAASPIGEPGAITDIPFAMTAFPADAIGLSETIVDAKGDILVATGADTITRLPVGSNDQVLTADSAQATGVKWATPSSAGIPATLLDAKGDIIVASAADTAARVAVGSNGRILTADSTQSAGVKWGFSILSQLTVIPAVADWWSEPHDAIYTGTPSLSRCLYVPFYIPAPVSEVDGIAVEVTTVAASGLTRLGLYLPHATTHKPDARVIDGGTVDTSSGGGAAGVRTLSISATAVAPDSLIYVAVCAQTASATLRLTNTGELLRYLGIPSSTVADVFKATNASCFYENSVTGALPSTATPVASYSTTGQPVVALKRSA